MTGRIAIFGYGPVGRATVARLLAEGSEVIVAQRRAPPDLPRQAALPVGPALPRRRKPFRRRLLVGRHAVRDRRPRDRACVPPPRERSAEWRAEVCGFCAHLNLYNALGALFCSATTVTAEVGGLRAGNADRRRSRPLAPTRPAPPKVFPAASIRFRTLPSSARRSSKERQYPSKNFNPFPGIEIYQCVTAE